MIHGGNASIGCLALGDSAAEELFVLAADVRRRELPLGFVAEDWVAELHETIRREMRNLPLLD
ncbi:MAG: hypothetical protein ABGX49_06785 [Candidatus Poseidoniia archaeon]